MICRGMSSERAGFEVEMPMLSYQYSHNWYFSPEICYLCIGIAHFNASMFFFSKPVRFIKLFNSVAMYWLQYLSFFTKNLSIENTLETLFSSGRIEIFKNSITIIHSFQICSIDLEAFSVCDSIEKRRHIFMQMRRYTLQYIDDHTHKTQTHCMLKNQFEYHYLLCFILFRYTRDALAVNKGWFEATCYRITTKKI